MISSPTLNRSNMLVFDLIAEEKIATAIARGELSNLAGAGRPLDLDDDKQIPEELRMAYRVLKNAVFVPPEIEALREIGDLERIIDTLAPGERSLALRKLQLLRTQVEFETSRRCGLHAESAYTTLILERLGKRAAGD